MGSEGRSKGSGLSFPLGQQPGSHRFGHSGGPLVRPHPAHDLSATPVSVLARGSWHASPSESPRIASEGGLVLGGRFLQVVGRSACPPPSQTCIRGSGVRLILVCACHQPKPLVTTFSRPFTESGVPPSPTVRSLGWCRVHLLGS